ncbi:hypothetical protein [Micromonospora sp. NPDC048169]|uniref:hypothetical protein n=1 Tax=Micromonospora sp. NPDC048169 TaxID=3154711 RepID=UPI0033E79E16
MTGSAYRTPYIFPFTDQGPYPVYSAPQVYVLEPAWINTAGVTDLVIVDAHKSGETRIYACDETGLQLGWEPLETFPACDYEAALRWAGYRIAPGWGPTELDLLRAQQRIQGVTDGA